VGTQEVDDFQESTSAKSSDYECEGRRPLMEVVQRCGGSTYEQGGSRGG
jgi:hypothetical protein